jgi:hypothetical protein
MIAAIQVFRLETNTARTLYLLLTVSFHVIFLHWQGVKQHQPLGTRSSVFNFEGVKMPSTTFNPTVVAML